MNGRMELFDDDIINDSLCSDCISDLTYTKVEGYVDKQVHTTDVYNSNTLISCKLQEQEVTFIFDNSMYISKFGNIAVCPIDVIINSPVPVTYIDIDTENDMLSFVNSLIISSHIKPGADGHITQDIITSEMVDLFCFQCKVELNNVFVYATFDSMETYLKFIQYIKDNFHNIKNIYVYALTGIIIDNKRLTMIDVLKNYPHDTIFNSDKVKTDMTFESTLHTKTFFRLFTNVNK